MWFIGGANVLDSNKCTNCNTVVDEVDEHFTILIDYDEFKYINDPRKYIKTICSTLNDDCIVCKTNRSKVTIKHGDREENYCIRCAGNELNKKFVNNQMGFESENIYYEELAIWSQETLGEDLLGECGECGQRKSLVLLNGITRGRISQDNPFGIEVGDEKNICKDCYNKDFLSAYIMDNVWSI